MGTSSRFATWLFLVTAMLSTSMADYPCICSYAVDTPLYSTSDTTSPVIGHVYEFDCKPQYTDSTGLGPDWDAVMIDQQIGYIQMSSAMSLSTCQGSIPIEDKVTTGPPTTPTTSTTVKASSAMTTPTTISTSSTMSTTSATSTPPNVSITSTGAYTTDTKTHSTTGQPNIASSISVLSYSTPPAAQLSTGSGVRMTGTSSISTSVSSNTDKYSMNPTQSTSTSTVLPSTYKHTTAVGLPSTKTQSTATPTTSTASSTTTSSISMSSSTMKSTITPSTTSKTTTRNPTTERVTHPLSPYVSQAPVISYKCPSNVIHAALHNHGAARVYGSTCYEFVPGTYQWQDAEINCKNKGGHLVHIKSSTEENHVMQFLNDIRCNHPVWLGLTDLMSENNFHWTSGDPVTFTKWLPGHTSNFISHHYEDCVVLVPYIHSGYLLGSYGYWDDISCNLHHSWICQFDAVATNNFVGSANGGHGNLHFTTKTPMFGSLGHIFDLIGRK